MDGVVLNFFYRSRSKAKQKMKMLMLLMMMMITMMTMTVYRQEESGTDIALKKKVCFSFVQDLCLLLN